MFSYFSTYIPSWSGKKSTIKTHAEFVEFCRNKKDQPLLIQQEIDLLGTQFQQWVTNGYQLAEIFRHIREEQRKSIYPYLGTKLSSIVTNAFQLAAIFNAISIYSVEKNARDLPELEWKFLTAQIIPTLAKHPLTLLEFEEICQCFANAKSEYAIENFFEALKPLLIPQIKTQNDLKIINTYLPEKCRLAMTGLETSNPHGFWNEMITPTNITNEKPLTTMYKN